MTSWGRHWRVMLFCKAYWMQSCFCPHVFGDVDGNGFTRLLVGNIFQTCQHVLDMLPVVFVGNLFVGVFELVRFGLYSVAVGHRKRHLPF